MKDNVLEDPTASTLKMEVASFFKMFVSIYQAT
jgi:hypothetical protein